MELGEGHFSGWVSTVPPLIDTFLYICSEDMMEL